jgi:hypothetical protein
MIDRMSGRISLLLVSAALVLIVLLGWFVLIAPQQSKASKLDSDINQTNVELQAVTSLLQGPIGRQSLAALRVSRIAVPDEAKMSQILRQLSTASGSSGIQLSSISPQALVPAAGAEALPMSVVISGHYFAIQRFLRILRSEAVLHGDTVQAHGRLYTVDSIQFTGQTPAAGQAGVSTATPGVVQATLTINAFVYAPTPAVAPDAATTGAVVTPTAP